MGAAVIRILLPGKLKQYVRLNTSDSDTNPGL